MSIPITKIVQSLRPLNLFIVFFTMMIVHALYVKLNIISTFSDFYSWIPDKSLIYYAVSLTIIFYGGYLINDIIDVKTDLVNKPQRVLYSNSNNKRWGYVMYFLTIILGAGLSILSFLPLFYLNCALIVVLFLYSKYFKQTPFIGNFIVSVVCSIPSFTVILFYYFRLPSEFQINNFTEIVIFFTAFSFFATLVREIIKDAEDIEGDKKQNMKTLPILLGTSKINLISNGILTILLLFIAYFLFKYLPSETNPFIKIIIAVIMVIPLPILMFSIARAEQTKDYAQISKKLKTYMLMGLLTLLLLLL